MRHQIKIAPQILFSGPSEQSPKASCFPPWFFRAVTTFYGISVVVVAWGGVISGCVWM